MVRRREARARGAPRIAVHKLIGCYVLVALIIAVLGYLLLGG